MAEFPTGVAIPGGASYTSPLLDFSPLGDLQKSYQEGVDNRFKNASRTAFRNGIPKTPDGNNDYKAMTDKMIQLGDYGNASAIGNLGYQQGSLDQLTTNPEAPGYRPQQNAPAPAARQPSASPAAPRDERPARANNSDGFDPPSDTTPSNSSPTAGAAPTNLSPQVKAEIDRRLPAGGDTETRKRNFGRLMASPFPGIKEYAKARLEALLKDEERTPGQKEQASGTTQYNTDVATAGKNRELTPEQKNTGTGFGAAKPAAQVAEDIKVEGANRTDTPEQKNLRPGPRGAPSAAKQTADIAVDIATRTPTTLSKDIKPLPGESPVAAQERLKTEGAINVESGKLQVKNFDTEHVLLQKGAQVAANGIEKAKLAKSLTMQPGFYSGPLQRATEQYQQFKSVFGKDPTTAVPQEAFQKVTTDMLTEQIKSLGQSGVGRVLLAEVQNMQKGLASLGISAAGNRAQLEIFSRVSQQVQELSAISRQIALDQNIPPQDKAVKLDQAIVDYYKSKPIFTEQEKNDPRILSAPDVPSNLNTPAAVKAWAAAVGLSPGNLVKWNGQLGAVP